MRLLGCEPASESCLPIHFKHVNTTITSDYVTIDELSLGYLMRLGSKTA
jgi:hypothetical protein